MKPVYLAAGAAATAVAVVGFYLLVTSVFGACESTTNALACLMFVAGSVAAAYGWVNGLGIKVKASTRKGSI